MPLFAGSSLPRRLPPTALLPPAAMAAVDAAAAAAGQPTTTLMARAGFAVALCATRHFPPCRTLVLCGPGNNGGDGYVAAALLRARGWPVRIAALAPPRPGTAAAQAAAAWRGRTLAFTPAHAAAADLVIDAVFGAGLNQPLPSHVVQMLAPARRVLAIDVPSGLDGATGLPRGPVRAADHTITFARYKPGHFLLPGRDLCGALHLADIGIAPAVIDATRPDCFLNLPGLWTLPSLAPSGHKYSRGHVTILGGALLTGAARLAATAARAAGAGLVSIAATNAAMLYRATCDPGIMVADSPIEALLADARRQVWLCGPGLGAGHAATLLPRLIEAGKTIVADADALTACANSPESLRGVAVITPHAAEFARVFGEPTPDKLTAARAAASRTGAVTLLKGSDTLIVAPDGRAAINAAAPPTLATAGAGDVLAGIIAGLLGQGMSPFAAAAAAAWLHGRAAAHAGAHIMAEDIAPEIGDAWEEARAFFS